MALKEVTTTIVVSDYTNKEIKSGGWALNGMGSSNTFHFYDLAELLAALNYHGREVFGLSSNMYLPALATFQRKYTGLDGTTSYA